MTQLLVVPAVNHQYADGLKISTRGENPTNKPPGLIARLVRGIAPAGFPASDPVANLKKKSTLTDVLYLYQRLT